MVASALGPRTRATACRSSWTHPYLLARRLRRIKVPAAIPAPAVTSIINVVTTLGVRPSTRWARTSDAVTSPPAKPTVASSLDPAHAMA